VRLILLHTFREMAVQARATIVPKILEYADELDLRPWFAEWNRAPYPIPTRMANPKARALPMILPVSSPVSSSSPAERTAFQLLSGAKAVATNEEKVLYILLKSGGFRKLLNSKSDSELAQAFALSKNQFSKAFLALLKLGYVSPSKAGLELTKAGAAFIESTHSNW
jgi:hypothetical protein